MSTPADADSLASLQVKITGRIAGVDLQSLPKSTQVSVRGDRRLTFLTEPEQPCIESPSYMRRLL